jgi:hypothetical protein
VNGAIDLKDPNKLQGMLAENLLELYIGKRLLIDSHLVGGEKVVFKGKGSVINNNEISKTDSIESHVPSFTNAHIIRAYKSIVFDNLSQGLTNNKLMLSEGSVDIRECAKLINRQIIEGRVGDVSVRANEFENDGSINSLTGNLKLKMTKGRSQGPLYGRDKVQISVDESFDSKGSVQSKSLLALDGHKIDNNNLMQARALEANLQTLNNDGEMKAENARFVLQNLTNKKDIIADRDLNLDLKKAQNLGVFQANSIVLSTVQSSNLEDKFINDKMVYATESLTFKGKGATVNNDTVISDGVTHYEDGTHINKHLVQSQGDIDILGGAVTNEQNAKILSHGNVNVAQNASVMNHGLFSGNTITSGQASQINNGAYEAKKDISFPNCLDFKNEAGSRLHAMEGSINFPKLNNLDNHGNFLSFNDIKLTLQKAKNSGEMITPSLFQMNGQEVVNSKLMRGDKGVEITSQRFEQNENGVLESKLGKVRLVLPSFDQLKGKINTKNVEFVHTGDSNFTWPEVQLNIEGQLLLDLSHCWDMKGQERKVAHNLHLKGAIVNPANLTISGDFTWETNSIADLELASKFRILVEGVFTLIHNGVVISHADLQSMKGIRILPPEGIANPLTKFVNKATFYSSGNTLLNCPMGVENFCAMEIWGDCELKTAHASVINHPNAQLVQRNFHAVQSIFKMFAGGNVDNCNAVIYIEGIIDATSQQFLNRASKPETSPIQNKFKVPKGKNGRLKKEIAFPATKDLPVLREDGQEGSLLHVGGGTITTQLLHNYGSVLSTVNPLTINDGNFINETIHFVERGLKPHNELKGVIKDRYKVKRPRRQHPIFIPDNTVIEMELSKKQRKKLSKYAIEEDGKFKFILPVPMGDATKSYVKTSHHSFVARVYSLSGLFFKQGNNLVSHDKADQIFFQNTGEVLALVMGINGGSFQTSGKVETQAISHRTIPSYVSVTDYFNASCLKGPSFWKVDTEKKEGFQVVPTKPIQLPSLERIMGELDANKSVSHGSLQTFLGEIKQGINEVVKRNTNLDTSLVDTRFWNPKQENVDSFVTTLTPEMLVQIPPRIAIAHDQQFEGIDRMHHHPALVAELVMKTFLDNIGFSSISRKITSPELLVRVMEEMGYLSAIRLHEKALQPVAGNWATLSDQEKFIQQLREFIRSSEMEKFKDPAIVYRVWEDFGERVFSAQIVLPESVRQAFQSKLGHVGAHYLSIDVKEVKVDKGSVGGQKALLMKTSGVVTNEKGVIGDENGQTVLNVGETHLLRSGLDQGSSLHIIAKKIEAETLVTRENIAGGYRNHIHEKARMRATINDLDIISETTFHGMGVQTESAKDTNIVAHTGIVIQSQQTESEENWGNKKHKYHKHTLTHHKSTSTAGGALNILSQANLLLAGYDAKANSITTTAAGKQENRSVTDSVEESHKKKKKKFAGKKTKNTESATQTAQNNVYDTQSFTSIAGEDNVLQAITIQGAKGEDVKIVSLDGKVIFEGALSSHMYSKNKSSKSVAHVKTSGKESYQENYDVCLLPKGFVVESSKDVEVHIPVKVKSKTKNGKKKGSSRETIKQALDHLQNQPGYEWINDIRKKDDVNFEKIEEITNTSKHSSFNLTSAAQSLICLAITLASAGAASIVAGAVANATTTASTFAASLVEKAVSAGFKALVSSAGVSFANNRGDLKKTFKDLGRSQSIRGILTSMVVAGATMGVADFVGVDMTPAAQAADVETSLFADAGNRMASHAVQAGVSSGMQVIAGQMSLKEALKQGVINVAANTAGELAANHLCKLYDSGKGPLGYVGHKAGHFLVGGTMGTAMGHEDPLNGFFSGGLAGAGTEMLVEVLPSSMSTTARSNMVKLAAGAGAMLMGGDVNIATMAASNAVENNAFLREAITAEGIKREQQELQGYEETGEEVLSLFSAGIPALVEFYENIEAPHRAFSQELQQEINKPELSWFEHFSLSTMAEEHRLAMSGAALLPTSALDTTLLAAPLARVAGRAIAQGSKSFFKKGSGMLAAELQTPIQFELKANTFFVRDAREAITDATSTLKNKVGGLFGKTAPEAVAREETKAIAESSSKANAPEGLVKREDHLDQPSLVVNEKTAKQRPYMGEYKDTKGHHVHAKKAFEGHVNYDPSKGFSISNEFMDSLGIKHQKVTGAQQKLYKEFAKTGKSNTLSVHTRIAVESLVEAGLDRKQARSIVAESLKSLKKQEVREPTTIPWKK